MFKIAGMSKYKDNLKIKLHNANELLENGTEGNVIQRNVEF